MDFSVALSWVLARLLIGGVPPRDHRPHGLYVSSSFTVLFGFYIVVIVFYVYVFLVQFTPSPPHLLHVPYGL